MPGFGGPLFGPGSGSTNTPTYTWQDALNLARTAAPRLIQDGFGPLCCDIAQSMIWNAYDWRQSIVELEPFSLVASQQDYDNVPTDFLGLRSAQIYDTQDDRYHEPLEIRRLLRKTDCENWPSLIAWHPELNKFRLEFSAPANIETDRYQIVGTYKYTVAKIDSSNLSSVTVPVIDPYFMVCVEALRYQLYVAAGDPRAGSVSLNRGRPVYIGQLAIAMENIDRMAAEEGANLGDPVGFSPRESLVK